MGMVRLYRLQTMMWGGVVHGVWVEVGFYAAQITPLHPSSLLRVTAGAAIARHRDFIAPRRGIVKV